MWRGRCRCPLPLAVTYTHPCTENCLPSNELAEMWALLHMLVFAWCISAVLLFVLEKYFSVPDVIFKNWQVGFCKWIKFILNMDIVLHQKTKKRQEKHSRTHPSLCQSCLLAARRDFKWGERGKQREKNFQKILSGLFLLCTVWRGVVTSGFGAADEGKGD